MSFIGVSVGVGTGLLKTVIGMHQNKLANGVNVPDATYSASPYASKILGQANMMLNAPMPGAATAENDIQGNQSDAIGSAERNATSGTQALAMLGGIQGNTNNADNSLATQQGQYKLNAVNNYNQANQGMVNEGDKVYQSDLQNRLEAIQQKTSLRGAAAQNIGGGLNDISNNAFLMHSFNNSQS
jgi:hypothetical protein